MLLYYVNEDENDRQYYLMYLRAALNDFYVYILSNKDRSSLKAGSTGDLHSLVLELEYEWKKGSVDLKGFCYHLLYWEPCDDVKKAIARKEEMNKWSRKRMEALIDKHNPEWQSLNNIVIRRDYETLFHPGKT